MAQIHELLPKVMADIGAIGKNHRNKAQSYDFRSIDDALNVVQPVLVKHGISIQFRGSNYQTSMVQEPKAAGQGTRTVYRATLTMDVSLFAPDGSSVTHTSAGEGMDYGGDKATNKALAAAFKYAIFLGLCIPVAPAQLDDSDRDEGDAAGAAVPTPTTPPDSGKYAEKLTDRASQQQFAEIKRLMDALVMPAEIRKAALAKRGATKPAELTIGTAIELIGALEQALAKREAQERF